MFRYSQTLARIGAGLVALGTLAWLMWPSETSLLLEPEPLFAFLTASVVWLLTEFKQSEEVLFRRSSPNDIRTSKQILSLHKEEFRTLLCNHDLFGFIDYTYLQKLDELLYHLETTEVEFQNKRLAPPTQQFFISAKTFRRFMAENTTPTTLGGREVIGFKPNHHVPDAEYKRRHALAQIANQLASDAWAQLESLVRRIKTEIPEALD